MNIPEKELGVIAYGIKTGLITSEDTITDVIKKTFKKNPELIKNNDILCITESVVAITQNNIVKLSDISLEISSILKLKNDSVIGIIHPILSRNRFSMVLNAIAKTVPQGKVIIQLSFPEDEQGNPIISKETLKRLNKNPHDIISLEEIGNDRLFHPETGIDYIDFYQTIVRERGCQTEIFLSNVVEHMIMRRPDAIIVSNVHKRKDILEDVKNTGFQNVITLQGICSDPLKEVYSDYGLLGSNILDPANEELKLMPKNPKKVCEEIQKLFKTEFNKDIEVIIYGDGAYKDPESGIYELADPVSCFSCTKGIENRNRIGVKTKYLVQKLFNEGKSREEIELIIEEEGRKFIEKQEKNGFLAQGTTPRKIENLISSLADLVSGSGNANTPIVVVRNFI